MTFSKYQLGFMEIFHPYIHGLTVNSDPAVLGHYMVFQELSTENFLQTSPKDIRNAERAMGKQIEFYRKIIFIS